MSFDHTRAALAVYDAGAAERSGMWDQVQTNEDVAVIEREENKALRLVQDAFFKDTKHINSREHCRRADLAFMRRMAALPTESVAYYKETT